MKYFLVILLFTGCSAEYYLNKALKKNPRIVQAEVIYHRDTIPVPVDGEIVEVPVEIPVPVEVVKWRTRAARKADDKIAKEEAKQAKIQTRMMSAAFSNYKDSARLAEKEMRLENNLLRQQLDTEKERTKQLRKENRGAFMQFLADWWWLILILLIMAVFLLRGVISRFLRFPVN